MQEIIFTVVPTAFFLSFGHCIGMCGGFVISYTAKLKDKSKSVAFGYSFAYHSSRVVAYMFLGLIGGFFGSIFATTSNFMGIFQFIIGAFLVILGVALIKRGEILKLIENDKIWSKFLAKPTKFAMSQTSLSGFCLLGFLNGLIPCGVVYTFLAMAILSGSVVKGIFIMFVFGISTMPTLLGLSFISNALTFKFQKTMLFISGILVVLFGVHSMYLGFMAYA
ncbi:MAG: sulfite exporter TauE/SafE family protein [Campylobacter sp.]|nr:sulfite exporter TauE/SafE family protein [Campylobacter sp.]